MRTPGTGPLPWDVAWHHALYGPDGFFTAGAGPAAHFRTAVHAAPGPLAGAVARLARQHGCAAVLDIGAGRGELLAALAASPGGSDLALHGVDVVPRPTGLPDTVGWSSGLDTTPDTAFAGALVVAWELLDDVPCPVLEVDDEGVPRTVLVDPVTGIEELGPPAPEEDLDWCRRWWPLDEADEGDRLEVGRTRDELWAGLVRRAVTADRAAMRTGGPPPTTTRASDRTGEPRLSQEPDGPAGDTDARGADPRQTGASETGACRAGAVLLAVDYAHSLSDRPSGGSLMGYRAGRVVPPRPDGTVNVTAHVALDAVAAAGEAAGAVETRLTDQRTALLELGLGAPGSRDDPDAPGSPSPENGAAFLRRLAERSQVSELLDRGSLGSFGWLLQRF